MTPTCAYPTNSVVTNRGPFAGNDGKYKTIEFSLNKRQSHNYSLGLGYGYTWQHDYPLTFPNTPNGAFDYDYTSEGFKANGRFHKHGFHVDTKSGRSYQFLSRHTTAAEVESACKK